MDRDLLNELVKWKNSQGRKPLLLRGARQVGQSWLVEEFGRKHFTRTLTVNLELHADYRASFSSLNPIDIIISLELLSGQTIDKNTLLFLDEIQECPDAIRSLRYLHTLMGPFCHYRSMRSARFTRGSDGYGISRDAATEPTHPTTH